MSKNKQLTVAKWLGTDDQMCTDIVDRKYLLEEEVLGHKETVDKMLDRVSGGNEEARKLMLQRKFLPGGRIIANRGLQKLGIKVTYSNCYVDPAPEDSIESIYETCKRLARTFSYGGGIGIDISKLAPKGAKVRNTARQSTGAVSFINTFSEVAETIGMHGRRGALMISIDGKHPDLLEFITHKSDLGITQGANMSVRFTDDFFEAVQKDEHWTLEFTRKETGEKIEKIVNARDVLQLIAKTNWDYAEPGILFWDRITKYNLMSEDESFSYAGTNPCGEEPLPAGGSCLLGAMNLSEYYNKNLNIFEYSKFGRDVRTAVRYLNEVLDEGQELHPLQEQRDTVKELRQIGLGFMGLADLFIKMGIEYGSSKSLEVCHHIGYIMIYNAIRESVDLAAEKGEFEKCNPIKIMNSDFWKHNIGENPWISDIDKKSLVEDMMENGIRNSQLLTCAPTGTISTILNISGGIEPMFALHYTRTTKSLYGKDKTYTVYPNAVKDYMETANIDKLDSTHELPFFMVTSRDIPWVNRINVQAAWQEHIDASISATINLPEDTTVDEIADLYTIAHENGLKGITIYRENCKRTAILNDTSSEKKEEPKKEVPEIVFDEMEKAVKKAISQLDAPIEILLGPGNEDDHYSWKEEHNCHGDPKECTLENKCPDCSNKPHSMFGQTDGLAGSNNIVWDGDNQGDQGEPGPVGFGCEDVVKAIKKSFLSSFSPILTRSDFGENLHGSTYYQKVACGHIYITVNRYAGRPVEVFMQSSKSGGCAANTEALGRLASTMLRAGIDPSIVVDSTLGVKCAACSSMKGKGEKISGLSCSDVMARVIRDEWDKYLNGEYDNEVEEYISSLPDERVKYLYDKYTGADSATHVDHLKGATNKDIEKICNDIVEKENCKLNNTTVLGWNYKEHTIQENIDHSICPECGAKLRFSEGCMKCDNCGFSKC